MASQVTQHERTQTHPLVVVTLPDNLPYLHSYPASPNLNSNSPRQLPRLMERSAGLPYTEAYPQAPVVVTLPCTAMLPYLHCYPTYPFHPTLLPLHLVICNCSQNGYPAGKFTLPQELPYLIHSLATNRCQIAAAPFEWPTSSQCSYPAQKLTLPSWLPCLIYLPLLALRQVSRSARMVAKTVLGVTLSNLSRYTFFLVFFF